MAERTSGSGGIPGRISRLRMRKCSELDRDPERRDQRAALLFDVLHPVALLGSRSRRVLDDAGAHQPDVLMSTGVIENPSAPPSEQRYKMKYIRQASGTLVPTLGVTVEF